MKKYILLIIVLLAFGLRVYKLDTRPLGFTWDEAALGYNAYSLLSTGRDEHGEALPWVFKSFGDYKPGAYVYFTVPSVAFLGLEEFSTRLPSAIIGTLLVLSMYLLCKYLTPGPSPDSGEGGPRRVGEVFPLAVAGLFAVNPWAIHFSRGAWEVNLYLLLLVLGVLTYLYKKYYLAALFFGLSLFAYQGAKLFTPLTLGLLFANFRPEIKKLLLPSIAGVLLSLPLIVGFSSQSGRLKIFSAFSYSRSQDQFEPNIFFHNNILDQTRGIAERYLNYFSPRFLFFQGDWTNLRHSLIYYGYFHLPEILTITIGLVYLLKSRNPKIITFIFGWLVLAPLPAALSRDLVTGVRSFQFVIPLIVFSGLGLVNIKNKFALVFVVCGLMFSLLYYLDLYYVHTPTFGQAQWLYPYTPAFASVKNEIENYDRVVFTTKLGQPYIFALFHLKVDPRMYQSQNSFQANASGDVGEVARFGKFEFRTLYWPEDRNLANTLFVGDFYELPEHDLDMENVDRISEVPLPDNLNGLRVVGLR